MIEKVWVRNRKTGKEKEVPPKTAEMMKTIPFLMEEWEVPKPGSPTPHDVVQFIERKNNGEDLQPEKVVEFTKAEDDPDAEIKKAEAIIEAAKKKKAAIEAEKKAKEEEEKAKVLAEAKQRAEKEAEAKEDLSLLSVKKLADRIEYLTPEQLEGLKADERVSIVRMVEKELKKRKDEKSNTGNQ